MKGENIAGVYFIRNIVNQKIYIGSSKNILNRWNTHKFNLKNNKHPNFKLQNSVNKYGINNFKLEIIEKTKEYLLKEQEYINKYNPKDIYNLSFIVNSGGANVLENRVLLLDLRGNIIKRFKSGVMCAKFLKRSILAYNKLNTSHVYKKKYRVVTPDFYKKEIKLIKSWKKYTKKTEYNKQICQLKIYTAFNNYTGEVHYFKTMQETGEFLNITKEAIRLCLLNGGYYKRLNLFISKGCLINKN